jgi:hypothetical protein
MRMVGDPLNDSRTIMCPKCHREMIQLGEERLGQMFGCTRNQKNRDLLKGEVHTYLCETCGYLEFYKNTNPQIP